MDAEEQAIGDVLTTEVPTATNKPAYQRTSADWQAVFEKRRQALRSSRDAEQAKLFADYALRAEAKNQMALPCLRNFVLSS
jgi:cyclopropane fatty-acyl-phospholipid synthase-like methyltransferase